MNESISRILTFAFGAMELFHLITLAKPDKVGIHLKMLCFCALCAERALSVLVLYSQPC